MVRVLDDADLVAAAVAGDREAFGAIYDRYSSQVFTMCAHMLGNRDDAADATSDVFLTAAERIDQLRDPSRLRVWLLAIARHNVYRRSSRRSRSVPVAAVEDMTGPLADHREIGATAESSELVAVLGDAAAGLDERDRAVLELQLLGLEGADLADALGVAPDAAYQASFRMKERLERSLGALLVARQGRGDCQDLDRMLRNWDGTFSVLWRKRVARHVDSCEVCECRRKAVPALLLGGLAGATTLLVAPEPLRDQVVAAARLGGATGRAWPGDGFPPSARRIGRRSVVALLVAVVVLLVVLVGSISAGDEAPPPGPTSTSTSTSLETTTSSTTVAPSSTLPVPSTTVPPSTTATPTPPRPGRPGAAGTPSTSSTSTTTTTTSTTVVTYPKPPKYPTYPTFPAFTVPTSVPIIR